MPASAFARTATPVIADKRRANTRADIAARTPFWTPAIRLGSDKSELARYTFTAEPRSGTTIEELERADDKVRAYSYTIVSAPLPVLKYRAELRVRDAGGGKYLARWTSTFEPKNVLFADAVNFVRGIYAAEFENLKKLFGA